MGTVIETHDVKRADDNFNVAWRAIKLIIKAHFLSPLGAECESVAVVSELINSHGTNLHMESFQVQNDTAKLVLSNRTSVTYIEPAIEI